MGLFDEIVAESDKKKTTSCQVRTLLEQLEGKDRSDVIDAIVSNVIDAQTIATVLQRRGFHVNGAAIRRHRRHECSCGRSFSQSVSSGPTVAASGAEQVTNVLNIGNEKRASA